jgi:hypothetical protein
MPEVADQVDVERIVAALRRDYSHLAARIRALTHSVKCECDGVTLRLHFPAIRQGQATLTELINVLLDYLTTFALPRTQTSRLEAEYGTIKAEDYRLQCERLQREAINLFKRAQEITNRSGEAGELLLYLLTEWILEAPQILAKMSLKTSRNMPVHGADGLHIGYSAQKGQLYLYWGEAKLYTDVGKAIDQAVKSIKQALTYEHVEHELNLVQRYIDLSGLPSDAQASILRFLNPFDERYNRRVDVTTCLIGFDFDAFSRLSGKSEHDDECLFQSLASAKLNGISPVLANALQAAGIQKHLIEMFFFPLPSVQRFRDIFQAKIGWKQ